MIKIVLILFLLLVSCDEGDFKNNIIEIPNVPSYFPDITFPEDNEFTQKRWELGKKLFFDPILSKDSSISCGSCHNPSRAFASNDKFNLGVEGRAGTRNSISLANIAYHPYYLREGSVPSLEMQVLVPIQEHNEFDFNILLIAERLNQIDEYVKLSNEAYSRNPDYFVIVRAIANFERTLVSGNSKFDKYYYQKQNVLSESEKLGYNLFFSEKTSCYKCHSDFNFTNYQFANNGLYDVYADQGRKRVTKLDKDFGLFKVPSLRNVEITYPYMHDGSMNTLEQVIEHYNTGGKNFINKDTLIKPLYLTNIEKENLIKFLKTLTDNEFLTNNNFKQ